MAHLFKTRNSFTGFLREVAGERNVICLFPSQASATVVAAYSTEETERVACWFASGSPWEEFYFEYKFNIGETSFYLFFFFLSWWVHSLALLMDLQGELVGPVVNKGFSVL